MSNPPTFFAREIIPADILQKHNNYEELVKKSLASQLTTGLLDKIQFRSYTDPNSYDTIVEASIIAMSNTEYIANYGHNHQRRGIADGTMAVMVNGNWKVMGVKPTPKPVKIETPKPKKLTASEYLKNKMTELKS